MNDFYEIKFPDDISYGAVGGPTFNTDITIVQSGYEQRTANWMDALHTYNVAHNVKTNDQARLLKKFFMQVRGRLIGFRFKDWSDFTIIKAESMFNDTGIATASNNQIFKKYYFDGSYPLYDRKITKIVADSFVLYKDDVVNTSYTINENTGLVDIVGFDALATYTFECEFDIPVRFGSDSAQISIDDFNSYSLPVSLQEIRS
jgi:uncharacterized protein (TIGR02217 family)